MKSILQNVKKRVGGGSASAPTSAVGGQGPNGGEPGAGSKGLGGGMAPPSLSTANTSGEDNYNYNAPANMSPTSSAAHGMFFLFLCLCLTCLPC